MRWRLTLSATREEWSSTRDGLFPVENQGGSDQVTPATKTCRRGPRLDHPSDVDLSAGTPI